MEALTSVFVVPPMRHTTRHENVVRLRHQFIRYFAMAAVLAFGRTPAHAEDAHAHHHRQEPQVSEELTGTPPATDSIYWLAGTWTTDAGTPMALKDLRDRPIVLTLLYLTCKQACPILTEDLKRTQAALTREERAQTRFVIVTLDPERDDEAAMRAYKAKVRGAKDWLILRGSPSQVMELAAVVGVRYRWVGEELIHTNKISVLDREGRIVYQATGLRAPVEQTVTAIRQVLR